MTGPLRIKNSDTHFLSAGILKLTDGDGVIGELCTVAGSPLEQRRNETTPKDRSSARPFKIPSSDAEIAIGMTAVLTR